MNRCVILHRTGDAEARDIQPVVHQQLRGLGYRRFVLNFVRRLDGRTLSGAMYSHTVPSPHQAATAAEQLFGRAPGTARLFDDEGQEVHGDGTPAAGVPRQPSAQLPTQPPVQPPVQPPARAGTPTPSLPGRAISHERIVVKANELSVVAQCPARADLPMVRLHADTTRGWIVEVSTLGSDGRWAWVQAGVLPAMTKGVNGER